ncbi:Flp pilus assembly protein CpaB [Heliobacterium gestii]|uniref:Flp pilus assembly protein CpaB n=1 Tax=Heliomicrobium gestii TaxID=2699 RepID=A0A845LAZ0_HELGE|nr:Flp pilus assembly protein CpaB [Heliomicrobium gestii]MBM7866200.1 pilus assembly protein CpaB [Heliomicrobium gestii]MZP42474.1 Flp pilus assembly protein CpaB [Heliomicrobium gestii]
MRRLERKSLFLALSVALTLTGLLLYVTQQQARQDKPVIPVVIAVEKIPARSVIQAKQIEETLVPEKYALTGHAAQASQVVGQVARETLFPGEQILTGRLVQGSDGLAAIIPNGYRAISVKVEPVAAVGGLVKRGDFIDILVFTGPPLVPSPSAKTIFENVEILETGPGKTPEEITVITLCMKPKDAETLFLYNKTGELRLALRAPGDTGPILLPVRSAEPAL